MENAVAVVNIEDYAMAPETIQKQVNIIQKVMHQVMREGDHFGTIPGCGPKPTLLKPGAEKLCVTFRLAPSYDIKKTELKDGHREYEVLCTLTHMSSGIIVGQGVGSCSTMEGKYRFRTGEVKPTGKPVPKAYWENRDIKLIGGPGHAVKKIDGKWEIVEQGERVEHDNPADYYNTALKMAKKRAHVDAALTATAASDIFTQDIEDMPEVIKGEVENPEPKNKNGFVKNPPVKEPEPEGQSNWTDGLNALQKGKLFHLAGNNGMEETELEDMFTKYFAETEMNKRSIDQFIENFDDAVKLYREGSM